MRAQHTTAVAEVWPPPTSRTSAVLRPEANAESTAFLPRKSAGTPACTRAAAYIATLPSRKTTALTRPLPLGPWEAHQISQTPTRSFSPAQQTGEKMAPPAAAGGLPLRSKDICCTSWQEGPRRRCDGRKDRHSLSAVTVKRARKAGLGATHSQLVTMPSSSARVTRMPCQTRCGCVH